MRHPKAIGDRSTLAIMTALIDAGFSVFLPFGENTRYDLIIDNGNALARVQCKTGRLRQGAVRFRTSSTYAHHPNPGYVTRDYLGQIDYFAVYCPDTGGIYLVPIEDIPLRHGGSLRIEPARNGQKHGIRQAADYEIAIVRIDATAKPGARPGA